MNFMAGSATVIKAKCPKCDEEYFGGNRSGLCPACLMKQLKEQQDEITALLHALYSKAVDQEDKSQWTRLVQLLNERGIPV